MRLPPLRPLRRALLTTIAGIAAGGLFAAAPALAAGSTISVAPAAAGPGQTVVISGSIPTTGDGSCPAGEPAILTSTAALFPPGGIGPQAARSASGSFRADYQVPKTTAAGTYEIGLRCGGGNLGIHTTVRVLHPAQSAPSSVPAQQPAASVPASGQGGGSGMSTGSGTGGWPAVAWLTIGLATGAAVGALGFAAWRRRRT